MDYDIGEGSSDGDTEGRGKTSSDMEQELLETFIHSVHSVWGPQSSNERSMR